MFLLNHLIILISVHEVFKKYPPNLRKRIWGSCGISHFNRSIVVVDENTLKVSAFHLNSAIFSYFCGNIDYVLVFW